MRRRLAPALLFTAAVLLAARPGPAVIAAGKRPPMPLGPPGAGFPFLPSFLPSFAAHIYSPAVARASHR